MRSHIYVAIPLFLLAACKNSAPAAERASNPWQGEWTFTHGDQENGQLSIRDCGPNGSCRIILGTYGRSATEPKQAGSCSFGNYKDPTSQEDPVLLQIDGKKASVQVSSSGKSCTVELTLATEARIDADLRGEGCKSWCMGYTHFPAVFTLRSRKPYLQSETYRRTGICYADDSRAIQAWCTDEKLFALYRTWKLRQAQLSANGSANKGNEEDLWQEAMLDRCKSASDGSHCVAEAYEQQIAELDKKVYGRLLDGKIPAEKVLAALYPAFDPRTARTGRKTDVNTKYGEVKGKVNDEMLVFFKIAEPSFLPGHLFVLDTASDAFDGYRARAYFSVLKATGSELVVVARNAIRNDDSPDGDMLPWSGERSGSRITFDLANYKINDSERAFGYRLAVWDGGTGADYGTETLVLHRLVSDGIKRILEVTMASHVAAWDNAENKVYKDKQERLILIVSPKQHEGNYDWIIKGRIINKRTQRSRAAKTNTYVWKNDEYVLAGGEGG